jgi:sulfate adenylyltransferase
LRIDGNAAEPVALARQILALLRNTGLIEG